MTDELLVALAPWLPQYAAEIPKARQRLADHERSGSRVKLRSGRGAARLETKTLAEMAVHADEARKNAAAADKANLTAA
jgi:alpha-galactosidase